jgi:hypothetical protein
MPAKARRLLEPCLEKDPKKRLRDIGDAGLLWEGAEAALGAAPRSAKVAGVAAVPLLTCTAALGLLHFSEKLRPRPPSRCVSK